MYNIVVKAEYHSRIMQIEESVIGSGKTSNISLDEPNLIRQVHENFDVSGSVKFV